MKKIMMMLFTLCPVFSFGQGKAIGNALIDVGTRETLQTAGKILVEQNIVKSVGEKTLNRAVNVTLKALPTHSTITHLNPGMMDMKVFSNTVSAANVTANMPSAFVNHSVLGVQPVLPAIVGSTAQRLPSETLSMPVYNLSSTSTPSVTGGTPEGNTISQRVKRVFMETKNSALRYYREADDIFTRNLHAIKPDGDKPFQLPTNPGARTNLRNFFSEICNKITWKKGDNYLRPSQINFVRKALIEEIQADAHSLTISCVDGFVAGGTAWRSGVEAMTGLIGIGDEESLTVALNFVKNIPPEVRAVTDGIATRLLAYKGQDGALQELVDYRYETLWAKGELKMNSAIGAYKDLQSYLSSKGLADKVQFPQIVQDSNQSSPSNDPLFQGALSYTRIDALKAVVYHDVLRAPSFQEAMEQLAVLH